MREKKYNYLIGDSYENFPEKFIVDERIDPDQGIVDKIVRERTGKKLYDDLQQSLFNDSSFSAENKEQDDFYTSGAKYYTIFMKVGKEEYRLSSDYIGPSVYWAKEAGLDDDYIVKFLKIGRTLGGHMLWPRGKKLTINTARAGNSGFYDRIDWTLLMIKIYYDVCISNSFSNKQEGFVKKCKELLPPKVCNYKQFEDRFNLLFSVLSEDDLWLKEFKTFNKFCAFFKLLESFVDSEMEIIELAPLFPILPNLYKEYAEKTINAITKRNEVI